MPVKIIPPTPSAYAYPLLIKHLLHSPMARAPDQEIVYRDLRRRTYREFRERIGRLASGLSQIGVDQGDVVAILEWDSDRYHECYFAIPMMGAVMQTVNVSLVPEDIAYTIIDSGATTVLFNADFLPLVEKLAPHLKAVKNYVLMHDRPEAPPTDFAIKAEYEALLSISSPYFPFPDFDENAVATIFHTTGTTGRPKGVYFSHRQMVLHTLTGLVEYGLPPGHGRFHRDDVYMPMTPMFHVHAWGCPYTATLSGAKLVFPGRYSPEIFVKLIDQEKVTFTHCVPTLLQMLLTAPGVDKIDLSHLKMVVGGAALPPSLARAAMARGMDVFSGYGQSESGPDADRRPPQIEACRARFRGRAPLPDVGGHRRADGRPARRRREHGRRAARRRGGRRDHRARARGSPPAISTTPKPRKCCGAAGTCTPATSPRSTRTATSGSPIVSRTSSRAAASGSRRSFSKTSSWRGRASGARRSFP